MKRLFIILLGLILWTCTSQEEKTTGEVQLLNKVQFTEVISGDVLLVDVRTSAEYDQGFIEGAVNIDFKKSDFEKRMSHFDREMPVAVYCAKGGRSAGAGKKLQEMGFAKVYDLKGGYTGWTTE